MKTSPNLSYLKLPTLLFIYFSLTLLALASWTIQEQYAVTGDEPHYLVMANGLFKHGQLEQTLPYQEEFVARVIYKEGLAPANAQPNVKNTHAVQGPHGLYNVHNIGLPLLLGLPFLLGGVAGAKLFMIVLSAMAVIITWKLSGLFTDDARTRFYATLLTTITLPIIPAANQIFPDLLAGIIALGGLFWLFSMDATRSFRFGLLLMACIAFLPWLQIKNTPTMLILGAALTYVHHQNNRDYRQTVAFTLLLAVSLLALLYYNHYAFGKISGPYPYRGASLEFSTTAIVVSLGLYIDQNHGFLFQNPVFFIGVFALGQFFRQYRHKAWVWLLVFFSLMVPNGLHNAWYGGFSIMGRFGWSAAVAFILPTLLGLVQLARTRPQLFRWVIALATLLQLYFYIDYAIYATELYNWAPKYVYEYPELYHTIYQWLPIFYRPGWAYQHPPNLAWITITVSLLLAGLVAAYNKVAYTPRLQASLLLSAIVLLLAGRLFVPDHQPTARLFDAASLSANIGHPEGTSRVAKTAQDQAGYISFGPYIRLQPGDYQLRMTYQLDLPADITGGTWDIYNSTQHTVIKIGELPGTAGKTGTTEILFETSSKLRDKYEFRTYWNGKGDMRLFDMNLHQKVHPRIFKADN